MVIALCLDGLVGRFTTDNKLNAIKLENFSMNVLKRFIQRIIWGQVMLVEIILGLLVLIQTYVVWNLMRKTELLETWVEDFNNTIQTIDNELKEIDLDSMTPIEAIKYLDELKKEHNL